MVSRRVYPGGDKPRRSLITHHSQQVTAFLFEAGDEEALGALRHALEVVPRVPAGTGGQVGLMGNAQSAQLLVQTISSAIPLLVLGIDAPENVAWIVARMNVQHGRVLPALLLAVVHVVQ